MLDAMLGLAVLGVLIVTLSVMVTRQNQAAARLIDDRAALRTAEQALLAMQNPGTPMPADGQGPRVSVRRLDEASGVGGRVWVEVQAENGGRVARVVGLVDEGRVVDAGGVR